MEGNSKINSNIPQISAKNFDKMFEVFIDSFSGATGGFFASLIFYPIENYRTRLQTMYLY